MSLLYLVCSLKAEFRISEMLSKFIKPGSLRLGSIMQRKKFVPQVVLVRRSGEMLPPNQYDQPLPKRLHLSYVLRVYWEVIPLFLVTLTSLSLMVFSIISACKNKVDVVFTTRSRQNISRTMDLRNPTAHKLITLQQRYEPWPEMQDVLDKMVTAEKRALTRLESCKHA